VGDESRGERRRGRPPLGVQVSKIEQEVKDLRQEVRGLKALLRLKDTSSTLLNGLLDQKVTVEFIDGETVKGELRWVDKYNYGIEFKNGIHSVNKGAVKMIGPGDGVRR